MGKRKEEEIIDQPTEIMLTDTETLIEKQFRFTRMIVQLQAKITELGFEYIYGEAYRYPIDSQSVHSFRLAINLPIYLNKRAVSDKTILEPIGAYWELLGGYWGGRANEKDHFSIEYQGRK